MMRRCERPGCGEPADLHYGIDAEHLMVWIEPLDESLPDRPGVLCRRHADSMVVPLRWTLDDRREAVPRLFRAPAASEPAPRPKAARSTRSRPLGVQLALDGELIVDEPSPVVTEVAETPDASQPGDTTVDGTSIDDTLIDDTADDEAADGDDDAARPEPPAATGLPWRPVFDPDDDLGGLLDVSSPLLSRAFNGRDRGGPAAPAH
ncbi:MAG: hypothetical protein QM733_16535 [Ilumatobacteraceae bacterium]